MGGAGSAKLSYQFGCSCFSFSISCFLWIVRKFYESNSELRDSESIPLNQGIYDYFLAEVRPHVNEAWLDMESIKIGYEISFNKYFYQHKPLRNLDEVANELLQLDKEADGLIRDILGQ